MIQDKILQHNSLLLDQVYSNHDQIVHHGLWWRECLTMIGVRVISVYVITFILFLLQCGVYTPSYGEDLPATTPPTPTQTTTTSTLKKLTTPTPKTQAPPKIVVRSGAVQLTEKQLIETLKKNRVWLHWESSNPPLLSALDDFQILRRVTIQNIERLVLVKEAQRRFKEPTVKELRAWVIQTLPGAVQPTDEGLGDFIRGRLKLRAHTPLNLFWEAAKEMYFVYLLRKDLVENLSEEEAKRIWIKRGDLAQAWLIQVPRVPTSAEITIGLKTNQELMRSYYDQHKSLFSQPLRLLVQPYWVQGSKSESARQQCVEIRDRILKGEDLDSLFGEYPNFTQGGTRTLKGRGIPKDTKAEVNTYTAVRLARKGWTFYLIKKVFPSYVRAFEERSVQRELSAAVLRERDQLVHAYTLSTEAQRLLRAGDERKIRQWAKKNRVRFQKPQGFFSSPNFVVPQVGKSRALHNALFDLPINTVTPIITVRQNYVIGKVINRKHRKVPWETEREKFMTSWRKEKTPHILDEWLSKELKDHPRWVSKSRLKNINLKALSLTPQPTASPESNVRPNPKSNVRPNPKSNVTSNPKSNVRPNPKSNVTSNPKSNVTPSPSPSPTPNP